MLKTTLLAAAASVFAIGAAAAQDFPSVTELPAHIVEPNAATPLSGADAIAVHETVTRVYLAEDARNGVALKQLVTDDFVQDHGIYGRLEGPDAFESFVLDNPLAFDHYRHMAMNIVTKATGDNEAEAVSYILVLNVHPTDESQAAGLPNILAHGVVRDRLEKEDGQWRIAHRIYDQFAVTASVVPDQETRLNAARTVSANDAN